MFKAGDIVKRKCWSNTFIVESVRDNGLVEVYKIIDPETMLVRYHLIPAEELELVEGAA